MIHKISLSLLTIGLAVCFMACDDKLKEHVSFDVYAEAEGSFMDGDVMVVNPNSTVNFHFTGDPDFITFYSGETGAEYANINRTELAENEITSELSFGTFAQYGFPEGTLRVYLATSFEGISKTDYIKDIEAVNDYTGWIDISDQCDLPTKASGTSEVTIPMNEYMGENLRIAFQYLTTDNSVVQSRWEINDLKIINTLTVDNSTTTLSAGSIGFTALDMYATSSSDAYVTATDKTSGKWNLASISSLSNPQMSIHSSSAGASLNHDWLISGEFKLNGCDPDVGTGIKTITQRVTSHSHTYSSPREYTVTFIATNANMDHISQVIRELKIRVVE